MQAIRLIPVVLFATVSLLVFKTVGLVGGSGYTLGGLHGAQAKQASTSPVPAVIAAVAPIGPMVQLEQKRSWAQEVLGFPEITGSIGGKPGQGSAPEAAKPAQANGAADSKPPEPAAKPLTPAGKPLAVPGMQDDRPLPSAGERAVLDRLQERRQELEARSRELDMREGLLKAAEKRLEARIEELKGLEAQVNATIAKKDEAEIARFKSLVSMYENMKAKEAARILERLELKVLLEVAGQINPRRMSDILAQMSPEAAERLTVELASRAGGRPGIAQELPKIEGKPRT